MTNDISPLPYRDTKPVGAADFYFAINATFRFILRRFGVEYLHRYWTDLGTQYYAPLTADWKQRGLSGIAAYWRAFFAAEPGAGPGAGKRLGGRRRGCRVSGDPSSASASARDRPVFLPAVLLSERGNCRAGWIYGPRDRW